MPKITNATGRDLQLRIGVTIGAHASLEVSAADAKTLAGHPCLTFADEKPAKKDDSDAKPTKKADTTDEPEPAASENTAKTEAAPAAETKEN